MTEEPALSPERTKLLLSYVTIQEQALRGCLMIFSGLQQSTDPEAAAVCVTAYETLKRTQDTLDAMIESLNHTHQ